MADPMVKEMDSAYAVKESNEDVTRVVQKYFPPGMKKEEVFKHLHWLKDQGFEIVEARHEGARQWPDGEIKPYREEQKRLARDITGSMVDYIAKKRYERRMIIFEKYVYITIRTDGETAIFTKGRIWPQTHVP